MTKGIDVVKKELSKFAKIGMEEFSKFSSKFEGQYNLLKRFYEADLLTRSVVMLALFMCIYAFMRISLKLSKYISKIMTFFFQLTLVLVAITIICYHLNIVKLHPLIEMTISYLVEQVKSVIGLLK